MWNENNTEGFTQAELDSINSVLVRLMAISDGIDESNLNDAIASEYREGLTEAELFEAVVKRLGLVR